MNQADRKKQTHLRCERQRREAINNGYSDLKDLLPANSSFVGCKTTNAAILFRASDYVKQLNENIKKDEEELSNLQTQLSALEMIAQQYESFSADNKPESPVQIDMMKKFLDSCFESFARTCETKDYPTITKTLLGWLENPNNLKKPAEDMISVAKK